MIVDWWKEHGLFLGIHDFGSLNTSHFVDAINVKAIALSNHPYDVDWHCLPTASVLPFMGRSALFCCCRY